MGIAKKKDGKKQQNENGKREEENVVIDSEHFRIQESRKEKQNFDVKRLCVVNE